MTSRPSSRAAGRGWALWAGAGSHSAGRAGQGDGRGSSPDGERGESRGDRRRSSGGGAELTPRDLKLLSFLAEHRLALDTQVEALLGTLLKATRTRLAALDQQGFLTYQIVFKGEPGCCQIRRPGLDAIGSSLPEPKWNLGNYAHDIGLAWLWLASHAGTFGPMREVIAERTLRSQDGAREAGELPAGVRLGGFGPGGRERIHYPDLLLVTPQEHRIAIELELTGKGRARRENILAGYATDDRIDAVLYLVEEPALRRALEETARQMDLSELVFVRGFRWGTGNGSGRSLARGRSSPSERSSGAGRPGGAALRTERRRAATPPPGRRGTATPPPA